jgi:biotin carboxyl carrier protein
VSLRREYLRGDAAVTVQAEQLAGDHWRVRVGAASYEFRVAALGDGGVRLVPVGGDAGAAVTAFGAPAPGGYMVRVGGHTFTLAAPESRRAACSAADGNVRAPMTGTVSKVLCKVGEKVAADQTLVVVTAMKMEHKLAAGIAGVVESVAAKEGATIEQGVVLAVVGKAT